MLWYKKIKKTLDNELYSIITKCTISSLPKRRTCKKSGGGFLFLWDSVLKDKRHGKYGVY